MPAKVSGAVSARNARPGPNLAATRPRLTVIPGGRNQPAMVLVAVAALDELHIDLVTSRAERLTYASQVREQLRATGRHLARERYAAAATVLIEIMRLTEQEAQRAEGMAAAPCPCGHEGAGHGPATDDALAVPLRAAA